MTIDDFASRLPFELDTFQRDAITALSESSSVLVAAPTGSGKTVVAEYACWHALETGAKCFYTTPLKALSNQKFGDLIAQHGARNVGLLTGDNSINGEAPLVVMTTEVLRNMLYEGSNTLRGLRYVVLDEVHYLQDTYRGAVWEEVLIHLPPEVKVVCLSATIGNVDEFGDWLRMLRGEVCVVVEQRRPVELRNLVLVGEGLYPLLDEDGQPNPELARVWARATTAASRYGGAPSGRPGYRGGNRAPGRARQRGPASTYTPTRVEMAGMLAREKMLPAICFIFSRAGCDAAVEACIRAAVDLTTDTEAERIEEFTLLRTSDLDPDDMQALRFDTFLDGLRAGVAAHHAGMLPIFKETVEELFALGLIKLVFATETLSLGINMPARSVVIERLTKFTGEKHEMLTPTDYTQLTGRAGRRGIDELGYAVTMFDPWIALTKLASLATVRAYRLSSSFRLSYNMAVNLVRRHDHETAMRVLNSSFAQFDADRTIVRLERELQAREREAKKLRAELTCDAGDVVEYARLRTEAAEAMSSGRGSEEVRDAIAALAPGDVIHAERLGRAIVLELPKSGGGGAQRLTVMTADRKLRRLGARDFRSPPEKIGRLTVRGQSWRSPKVRRTLSRELETIKAPRGRPSPSRSRLAQLVQAYESHPVHSCPDADEHMALARKLKDVGEDVERIGKRMSAHRDSIARSFERVLRLLGILGYADGWSLTDKGELLSRVYNESDLLVVECLTRGWFAGLGPDELAAVASLFVYEARGRDEPEPPPTPELTRYVRRLTDLFTSLSKEESRNDVELLRAPDAGFMGQIYDWARGATLEDVISEREISAGDFVRWAKQVVDLLQQLRQVADLIDQGESHDPMDRGSRRTVGAELAVTAKEAIERVQRGVVAYSSIV